ncbi:MAG: hypothetical protein V3V59_05780 [Thermodesulfovibrionales bacterium]
MNKWITILVFFILLFSQIVHAQSDAAEADDGALRNTGLYLDLGGRSDPDAIVGEIGAMVYPSENLSVRASLSFLAYENNDHILVGVNAGTRYNFGEKLSPFVGIGLFGGSSSEDIPAENDNIDNDNDGSVDEDGEIRTETTDMMASIYPELGFHVWATDKVRVTLSIKYHITTKGRNSDFQMYGLGVAVLLN